MAEDSILLAAVRERAKIISLFRKRVNSSLGNVEMMDQMQFGRNNFH